MRLEQIFACEIDKLEKAIRPLRMLQKNFRSHFALQILSVEFQAWSVSSENSHFGDIGRHLIHS